MKRVCVFIGMMCLMLSSVALRLYFCRLDTLIEGTYSAFSDNDTPILLSISKGYERVDINGGAENMDEILKKLKAVIVRKEDVGDISIVYAYSPCLMKSVELFGRRVNVMVALTPSSVVVGSPLIKGSF